MHIFQLFSLERRLPYSGCYIPKKIYKFSKPTNYTPFAMNQTFSRRPLSPIMTIRRIIGNILLIHGIKKWWVNVT